MYHPGWQDLALQSGEALCSKSALPLLLTLEDVEQSEAETSARAEAKSADARAAATRKRRPNRGPLPPHLPRFEMIVDFENKACPRCRGELHRIGKDVSEKLDVVLAQCQLAFGPDAESQHWEADRQSLGYQFVETRRLGLTRRQPIVVARLRGGDRSMEDKRREKKSGIVVCTLCTAQPIIC
jgi:hypothetical protein